MPKISVIIPVYNVEQYLRECLDSVVSQTLSDIEIIIINDGSPDNSINIIREYEKKDSRIVVIDKKNEGVGKARNDGLRRATGEYIAFMDSDDYYPTENVLEVLYNTAKENNVKVCGGRKVKLETDGSLNHDEKCFTEYDLSFEPSGKCKYADYGYDYGYWQFIFSRKMLIDNDVFFPPYRRFQDPPFFVKAMITAGEFYMCDMESYCYRMVPSAAKLNISKTTDLLSGLKDNLNMSAEAGIWKLHYLTAMRLYRDASFMAAKNINEKDFSALLSKIIKTMSFVNEAKLLEEGYNLPQPYLPEVFTYLQDATVKYERLRNNKIAKTASKLLKH